MIPVTMGMMLKNQRQLKLYRGPPQKQRGQQHKQQERCSQKPNVLGVATITEATETAHDDVEYAPPGPPAVPPEQRDQNRRWLELNHDGHDAEQKDRQARHDARKPGFFQAKRREKKRQIFFKKKTEKGKEAGEKGPR
jgi:hypothetical protein